MTAPRPALAFALIGALIGALTVVPTAVMSAQTPPDAAEQELRALVAAAPRLPQEPAPLRVSAPHPGFALGMVSWVAADASGTVYLLQRGDRADPIVAVDRAGTVLRSWGKGLFVMPHAIRVDPQGNVWTTDAASSHVIKFSPMGQVLLDIAVGGQPTPCANNFCGVTDVAFAANGHLFISDGYANARILEYTAEGTKIREWGSAGIGPGQFVLPHSIQIDRDGTIVVADRENGRVQRFDPTGKFLGEWRGYGKTFGLVADGDAMWLATQPRQQPNLSPGWLLKVDARNGRLLGWVPSAGNHGMAVTPSGDLLLGPGPALAPQIYRASGQEPFADLDRRVADEMARQRVPGVAVAIVRGGEVVRAAGYGLANVEHRVPVTAETMFQSGSLGKQFTAMVVMSLVESGAIALADPLTKFFPDAPASWHAITVRHLLTHTSGLPDYTGGTIDYRKDHTEDDLLKLAYGLTPEFAAGARWNYSNTGYVLLGIIVRKATGRFYGDELRDRVFIPLGMTSARVISEADIVPHRAAGYRLVDGELKNQEWVAPQLNTTADGSLYLSLRDLIAWERGLRARAVLTPESWRQVLQPVRLNSGKSYPYGFGWEVTEVGGQPVERHSGSWQGFQTYLARYRGDDLTVIVLANLSSAEPGAIVEDIAGMVNPALAPVTPTPIPDREPKVTARVMQMLADTAGGRLRPQDFAYMRAGFFPDVATRYAELLKGVGTPQRAELTGRRDLGDDRIYEYDVVYPQNRVFRVVVALAPDDTIAGWAVRPK